MKIQIQITGPASSGKTTAARFLADLLSSAGVAVELTDDNERIWYPRSTVFKHNLSVKIRTKKVKSDKA